MMNFKSVSKKIYCGVLMSLSIISIGYTSENISPIAKNKYVVKHLNLSELPVKTIVPIAATTRVQALAQAKQIAMNKDADIAEFRVDLLDFASDTKQVIALGKEINDILKAKPLLVTIRTANEGGKLNVSDEIYENIYKAYLEAPFFQLIDIEMFRHENIVSELTTLAHQKNILVVMSNHEFNQTPSEKEIVRRLLKQDHMGADILKIAVMPKSKQDVFTLMNATLEVSERTPKTLLTISMGHLGQISRVATANMGGNLSFGMIDKASAPGQIDVTELKQFLKTVQPIQ